jgi:hypothetical protein
MIEVTEINRYPLTGASAQSLEVAHVVPAGIDLDRALVLFDDSVEGDIKPRISQRELPMLACFGAIATEATTELYIPNYGNFYVDADATGELVTVSEFGDETPCFDLGDDFARRFQRSLNRPDIRLGLKTPEWLAGGVVAPSERTNRPIHIVTRATIREIQRRLPSAQFGADRFRPGVLVDGDIEPFEENEWVGKQLTIAGVAFFVSKLTARCPVPGYDQRRGINRKDVPKAYRELPKNDKNKPVVGVYAYPMLGLGESGDIAIGDIVSLS